MDKDKSFIGPSGRIFRRRNANPVLRKFRQCSSGKIVALLGRNRFDWEVSETYDNKHIKITCFEKGDLAKRYYRLVIKVEEENYKKIKM